MTAVHTVRTAKNSVHLTFFVVGFIFANWASRLPAIRDTLEFEPAQMGRLLLVGAVGSVLALPLSGWVAERLGAKRAVWVAAVFMCGGYILAATTLGDVPVAVTGLGLFLGGIGMGTCDTAMNLEGTRVEQQLGRSIMPKFHGMFSLGTMAGALVGAGVALLHIPVQVHVGVAIAIGYLFITFAARSFLPAGFGVRALDLESEHTRDDELDPAISSGISTEGAAEAATQPKRSVWMAWTEGRTWLIGLVILSAALTEGAANDWLSLGIVDGFDTSDALGAVGLFVFLSSMTGMRMVGTWLIDNYGRLLVIRVCSASAIVGLLLFALSPWLWLAILGAIFWGAGASLGFPIGMSAASDEPERAAGRVSVAATIGYTAFFAGPPILGELAQHVGYRNAMLAIMLPAVLGFLVATAANERGKAAEALSNRRAERAQRAEQAQRTA